MDSVRPVSRISQRIDTYSFSNKETEDFKQALAENVGRTPSSTSASPSDPIFDLIIRLLKESSNPSAHDLLNYYYVSCDASPDAIEYFYSQAKMGDAVARVQLGKLYREGKLANSAQELRVVAEAFASHHELAMLKLENQADQAAETVSTGSETLDAAMEMLGDEEEMAKLVELGRKLAEDDSPHRPQHIPVTRMTEEELLSEEQADKLLQEANLDPQEVKAAIKKVQKTSTKSTTKPKSKRSKNGAKAKKVKEPTDG